MPRQRESEPKPKSLFIFNQRVDETSYAGAFAQMSRRIRWRSNRTKCEWLFDEDSCIEPGDPKTLLCPKHEEETKQMEDLLQSILRDPLVFNREAVDPIEELFPTANCSPPPH